MTMTMNGAQDASASRVPGTFFFSFYCFTNDFLILSYMYEPQQQQVGLEMHLCLVPQVRFFIYLLY